MSVPRNRLYYVESLGGEGQPRPPGVVLPHQAVSHQVVRSISGLVSRAAVAGPAIRFLGVKDIVTGTAWLCGIFIYYKENMMKFSYYSTGKYVP